MPTLALELLVRLELAHEPPRGSPEDVGPEEVVPGAVVGERQQQHEADAEAARDDGCGVRVSVRVRGRDQWSVVRAWARVRCGVRGQGPG